MKFVEGLKKHNLWYALSNDHARKLLLIEYLSKYSEEQLLWNNYELSDLEKFANAFLKDLDLRNT